MQTQKTKAIVLSRTNYGEADRIVTLISQDFGKIQVIAKGVRKQKSKMAAGIEPFCSSDINFIKGRGELGTLTSARINTYFGDFISDLSRLDFGYSCLKSVSKLTAHHGDINYYTLLENLLSMLNNKAYDLNLIKLWWFVRVSIYTGYNINTINTVSGHKFEEQQDYYFVVEDGGFEAKDQANYTADHIKLIKLAEAYDLTILSQVKGGPKLAHDLVFDLDNFVKYYVD